MKTRRSDRKKSLYLRIALTVMFLFVGSVIPLGSAIEGRELRFRQIIDQPVTNPDGKKIAEIEDLIIRRHGKVKKAILSIGGLLGIGDKEVSVRFGALQIKEDGKIVCDATQQQIEKQPAFDYIKQDMDRGYYYHPYMLETPRRSPAQRHAPYSRGSGRNRYHYPQRAPYPPYYYPPGIPPRGYYPWEAFSGEYHPWEWAHFPRRMLGSFIVGRVVINKQGEEVADLEDLIIDQNDNVAKIILSIGGFLGMSDKLVAVPFKPLGFTDFGITYDITGEELEDLPAVEYEK
jgi:sporulation protein YlmC with PRC-barrel domain